MKKNKEKLAKVVTPHLACVASFLASYMEYQDRVGRLVQCCWRYN